MSNRLFDAVIVGGGPGGLSAGILSALRGMKVLILESGSFGGLLTSLYSEKLVLNYPGLEEGKTAADLASNMISQAKGFGVEMRNERVLKINKDKTVETEENTYTAKVIILATGSRPNIVGIPGEMDFNIQDRGVYYFVNELDRFKDKRVVVAGGSDTAVDSALALLDMAEEITLVHRRKNFRALEHNVKRAKESDKIKVLTEAHIKAIKGGDRVESVVLAGDVESKNIEIEADAVILAFGMTPNNEIFSSLGLNLDHEGRIVTDQTQKTNIPGVYAVGDIVASTGSLELIVVAAAQGTIAAHHAYLETATPYWG